MEQIRNVLKIILDWNIRNGMQLNKKKSGIVIFATRKRQNIPNMKKANQVAQGKGKSKRIVLAKATIEGVPICEEYKYLGTILTHKLECNEQISYIRRKAGFLLVKLSPYLKDASFDARKDIWQTMVKL